MVDAKSGFKYFLWAINALLYLVVIAIWIIIPEMTTLNICTSLFTLTLTMTLMIVDKNRFRKYYESPQFLKLTTLLIAVFLVASILGVTNYLFFKHPLKFDLSKYKNNSLTEETIKILKNINGEITFRIFGRKNEIYTIKPLVDLYRFEKNDINIELIDTELRPDLVRKHEIFKSGTIEIEYNNRTNQISEYTGNMELTELAITNGIIKLTRSKDPVIMFTEGHGELSLKDKNKEGISKISKILNRAYFQIKVENTLQLFEIAEDVDLVVIWGPKNAFMAKELQLIENYLNRGGRLLLAIDPSFSDDRQIDLRRMISRFGLKIDNNVVIDQISFVDGSNGSVPLINKIKSDHPILNGVGGPVFFPLVSEIKAVDNLSDEFEIFLGIKTGHFPASWADYNPSEMVKGKVQFNQGVDRRGPLTLFGTSSYAKNKTKIVAFGNSSFISNAYEKYGKNFSLFINSITWLTKSDEIDEFNLPIGKNEPIFLNRYQIGIIFYFSVLFLPIVFICLAIWFYKRKKKL